MKYFLVNCERTQEFNVLVQAASPKQAEEMVRRLDWELLLQNHEDGLSEVGISRDAGCAAELDSDDLELELDDQLVILNVKGPGLYEHTTVGELCAAEAVDDPDAVVVYKGSSVGASVCELRAAEAKGEV